MDIKTLHSSYTPTNTAVFTKGDIVECFDIVAIQIRITKDTKLTKKMIENERVVRRNGNATQK
jgi:hypothetical protein